MSALHPRLPIQTKRLILRVFTPSDAGFVLELVNDPSWIQNIGERGVRNTEDALNWINNGPLLSQAQHGISFYVVCLSDNLAPIGICGLIKRDSLQDVDLGYAFLPRHCGQGYAFEAATACMHYASQVLGMHKLAAITSPDNLRSNGLLQKLGFRLSETLVLPGETGLTNLYSHQFPPPQNVK